LGGVVLVEDETRVEFEAKEARIWAAKGKYPKVEITQEKKAHCFYGFLDILSGEHIVHDSERMISKETVKALDKIKAHYKKKIKDKKRILIIWDGAPWHRGEVKEYLKGKSWLELLYFPPYSSELNPEEQVWNQAKREITQNHEEQDFDELIYKFYRRIAGKRFSTKMCRNILMF